MPNLMDARGAPNIGCSCCSISWSSLVLGVPAHRPRNIEGFVGRSVHSVWSLCSGRHHSNVWPSLCADSTTSARAAGCSVVDRRSGIIPLVGLIAAIDPDCSPMQDSEPGVNQYGPNPKFPEQAAGIPAGNAAFAAVRCIPRRRNLSRVSWRCSSAIVAAQP